MNSDTLVETYLAQCRVRNPLVEKETVTNVPPTKDETKSLIAYLRGKGLKPAIVGSVGLLKHLGTSAGSFRPTVDLDIWVEKVPAPPQGWSVDPESPGVTSWISPSGGYVDFMTPNHEFPGGTKNPKKLNIDPDSVNSDYPVGSWQDLMRLKLNSFREKDLFDIVALVRKLGRIPSPQELGPMNQTQNDNFDLVKAWVTAKPQAGYGE